MRHDQGARSRRYVRIAIFFAHGARQVSRAISHRRVDRGVGVVAVKIIVRKFADDLVRTSKKTRLRVAEKIMVPVIIGRDPQILVDLAVAVVVNTVTQFLRVRINGGIRVVTIAASFNRAWRRPRPPAAMPLQNRARPPSGQLHLF